MRVLVTGYRSWCDIYALWTALNGVRLEAQNMSALLLVVHGACPTGADAMAEMWALTHRVPTQKYPADWNQHGRQAGPIRNQQMVDSGIDKCFAFLTKDSRGTWDCVERAKIAGIPVVEKWAGPK